MSAKTTTDNLRNVWVEKIIDYFTSVGEEVCRTASGTVYIPTLDENGDDRWVKVSVIVPKDTDEENGNDGYSLAQAYKVKLEADAEKAKAKEAEKAKKIARDAEKRAKAKAKNEGK